MLRVLMLSTAVIALVGCKSHQELDPLPDNAPWIAWTLDALDAAIARAEATGIGDERLVLGGFSQGAMLATDWAALYPPVKATRNWALTGALTAIAVVLSVGVPGGRDTAAMGKLGVKGVSDAAALDLQNKLTALLQQADEENDLLVAEFHVGAEAAGEFSTAT